MNPSELGFCLISMEGLIDEGYDFNRRLVCGRSPRNQVARDTYSVISNLTCIRIPLLSCFCHRLYLPHPVCRDRCRYNFYKGVVHFLWVGCHSPFRCCPSQSGICTIAGRYPSKFLSVILHFIISFSKSFPTDLMNPSVSFSPVTTTFENITFYSIFIVLSLNRNQHKMLTNDVIYFDIQNSLFCRVGSGRLAAQLKIRRRLLNFTVFDTEWLGDATLILPIWSRQLRTKRSSLRRHHP